MTGFWQWLTDFGDEGIVLPTCVLLCVVLLYQRQWRSAVAWAGTVVGVLGTMVVLKLIFGACGWELRGSGIDSPSGHTAASTMVYAGIGCLYWRWCHSVPRTAALALVIAGFVAYSRIHLHYHSWQETVLGGTVGIIGICLFRFMTVTPPLPRVVPALVYLMIVLLQHGKRLPAEHAIHSFASEWLRREICAAPQAANAPDDSF